MNPPPLDAKRPSPNPNDGALANDFDSSKHAAAARRMQLVAQLFASGRCRSNAMAAISDCFSLRSTPWDRETFADFSCPRCKSRVERKMKILTGSPLVFIFLGCACHGCVVHFHDDPGPKNARQWEAALDVLQQNRSDLLILNLNPDVATGLS
jgi:hypothetical protein